MQKRSMMLLVLFLAAILLACFVVGELGANTQVRVVSPASGSNFTNISLGNTYLNVTFVNSSGVTGIRAADFNVTYLMNNTANGTSVWFAIATLVRGCVRITGNDMACAANSTNVSIVLPDGTYTLNANITNATGSSIIANLTNTTGTIKIDRTPPISTTSNFSSPFYAGANISSNHVGLIVLNLSIADTTVGVDKVIVNITNRSSGISNATLTLTREGSTNNFVSTINTTNYIDGNYNITVIANDTLGNLNNTAVLENVIFDSTAPSITHTCDDYTVVEEEEIDCDCAASDILVGINTSYGTSGVSFTDSPSTSTTGNNFATTCTAKDLAGNSLTSTRYYNVSEVTGSSSGGGSGGSGGSTTTSSSASNSSANSSTNSATQNQSASSGNLLNANQGNAATPATESSLNIVPWVVGMVLIAAIALGAYFVIKRYGIKLKIPFLKPNPPR